MKLKKKNLLKLLEQVKQIKTRAFEYEEKYKPHLGNINPEYSESAKNLVHYLALRSGDIRELQNSLWQLGISRFGRSESHVMASIVSVENILNALTGNKDIINEKPAVGFKKGKKLLKAHTTALFGKKLKGSKIRIMVTLPGIAAEDYKLVKKLLKSGMNSARINCAHDSAAAWEKMINNINRAKSATGKGCKICMDLGGPKLRTGAMREGPRVVHLTPERDLTGNVISPAEAFFIPEGTAAEQEDEIIIPVPADFFNLIKAGDKIFFNDSRGKNKVLIAGKKQAGKRVVRCYESAYIKTGTAFLLQNNRESNGTTSSAGELMPVEESIILKPGDTLILHKEPIPGEPAEFNAEGELVKHAHISCTLAEIFNDVKPGESVMLDDGKIEGIIVKTAMETIEVEITYAKQQGSRLKGDKGINLPQSNLSVHGLTEKDKEDLNFITEHADIINYSFVNSSEDVEALLKLLKEKEKTNGIIFKIETKKAYENLPEILLAAMQHFPIRVMIARGDLAIECGWKELARIQEETMWICEAAHVPIIWATQVLETMAKKGRPSRAEVTDAALSEQAECAMLNKGPYIFDAIEFLEEITSQMQAYHEKKAALLPALKLK